MSQAGQINSASGPVPPTVATTYTENTGTATPATNNLNVLGSNGITTSGSGSTVTVTLSPTTGTWTPGISFGGASVGATYSTQVGYYTQIGNVVFCNFLMVLSNKGSSVGNASITGLPVSAGATNSDAYIPLISVNVSFPGGDTAIYFNVVANTTIAGLASYGGGVTSNPLSNAQFSNNSQVYGSFFYIIA